jgi:putative glutamine amidotransferase
MGKPTIGILVPRQESAPLARYSVTCDYIEQLERAGSIPVVLAITPGTGLAQMRKWAELCDGILLPGGGDLDPAFYGQAPVAGAAACTPYDRLWQQDELDFIRMASQKNLPILGICLGIQALNVAFGGTLVQDIPSQIPGALGHNREDGLRTAFAHNVAVKPGTLLAKVSGLRQGGEFAVNSFHHQAVGEAAPSLTVSAVSPDGVIEAVESAKHSILGVQWHPENLAAVRPEAFALFEWLIKASH